MLGELSPLTFQNVWGFTWHSRTKHLLTLTISGTWGELRIDTLEFFCVEFTRNHLTFLAHAGNSVCSEVEPKLWFLVKTDPNRIPWQEGWSHCHSCFCKIWRFQQPDVCCQMLVQSTSLQMQIFSNHQTSCEWNSHLMLSLFSEFCLMLSLFLDFFKCWNTCLLQRMCLTQRNTMSIQVRRWEPWEISLTSSTLWQQSPWVSETHSPQACFHIWWVSKPPCEHPFLVEQWEWHPWHLRTWCKDFSLRTFFTVLNIQDPLGPVMGVF